MSRPTSNDEYCEQCEYEAAYYEEYGEEDYFVEPDIEYDEGPWSIHDIIDRQYPGRF